MFGTVIKNTILFVLIILIVHFMINNILLELKLQVQLKTVSLVVDTPWKCHGPWVDHAWWASLGFASVLIQDKDVLAPESPFLLLFRVNNTF